MGKLQIWEALKAKNLNAKFLIGKALFLTPFKGTESRFSISCLVWATDQTKYTTYGNLHWVVLKLFWGVYFWLHLFKAKTRCLLTSFSAKIKLKFNESIHLLCYNSINSRSLPSFCSRSSLCRCLQADCVLRLKKSFRFVHVMKFHGILSFNSSFVQQ